MFDLDSAPDFFKKIWDMYLTQVPYPTNVAFTAVPTRKTHITHGFFTIQVTSEGKPFMFWKTPLTSSSLAKFSLKREFNALRIIRQFTQNIPRVVKYFTTLISTR